jgi:hypothetical protein
VKIFIDVKPYLNIDLLSPISCVQRVIIREVGVTSNHLQGHSTTAVIHDRYMNLPHRRSEDRSHKILMNHSGCPDRAVDVNNHEDEKRAHSGQCERT